MPNEVAPAREDADSLEERFRRWGKQLDDHWSDWKKEARDNYRFVAGEQWTAEEREALRERGRDAVCFNRIGPIVDAVVGQEILGRQEVKYLPREVNDTGANEIYNNAADWVRDLCDADMEESDAFKDAFICGIGWTETRIDDEQPDGPRICIDRIDPLEILADPSARKPNLIDGQYLRRKQRMSKDRFEDLFPGVEPPSEKQLSTDQANIERRDEDYDGDDRVTDRNEVVVTEWQWFESQVVHEVIDPETDEILVLDDETFQELDEKARENGIRLRSARRKQRNYWRANALGDAEIIEGTVEPLPDQEFTYKAITGKRDRNENTWYGLVRPMMDPQRWANTFLASIIHIIKTNAKGGVVIEESAAENITQFEESWARSDAVTVVGDGALKDRRIDQKTAPPVPQAMGELMQFSFDNMRQVTAINEEVLGLAERNQPGVLEFQRKQAVFGILASFFDAFRRYRRIQGRLLLKFINRYIPEGELIRIIGEDGARRFVPLTKEDDVSRYDVVVDEAPAGPNQVERTFGVLTSFMPLLRDADLPAEFWAEIIRHSPLPDSLKNKLAGFVLQGEQQDAARSRLEAQAAQQRAAVEDRATAAKATKDEAAAQKDLFEIGMAQTEGGAKAARDEADARLKLAQMLQILQGTALNNNGRIA